MKMLTLGFHRKGNQPEKVQCGKLNGHLVNLCDVFKTYQSTAGTFTALKDVDLQVEAGAFELRVVARRSLVGLHCPVDEMHGARQPLEAVEDRLLNEARVGPLVVVRHAAGIDEPDLGRRPVGLLRGGQLVAADRGRAAREPDRSAPAYRLDEEPGELVRRVVEDLDLGVAQR